MITVADFGALPDRRFSIDVTVDRTVMETAIRPDDILQMERERMARQLAEFMLRNKDFAEVSYVKELDLFRIQADMVVMTRKEFMDLMQSQYMAGRKRGF